MERFYTRLQAAEKVGVAVGTIDRAKASKELRCAKDGYTPLFSEKDLLKWKVLYDRAQDGIITDKSGLTLYSGGAAARYIGMTRQGVIWNKNQGYLKPDFHRGKRDFFTRTTLDEFKRGRQHAR